MRKLTSWLQTLVLFFSSYLHIKICLNSSEWTCLYKKVWVKLLIDKLKGCNKEIVTSKSNLGIALWHHYKDRYVSTSLHKLRSGHNHLNGFLARIDELLPILYAVKVARKWSLFITSC